MCVLGLLVRYELVVERHRYEVCLDLAKEKGREREREREREKEIGVE